jgi:uncharacterized MAPEG superfamily protein
MTTPFWCLVVVALLPYVLAGVGGYFRIQQLGTLDNQHPRIQAQQLEGIAARAYAAQQNAWEALPFFGVAVVLAHLAGADPGASATAAIAVLGARILHPILYLADQATARSLIFFVGLIGCCRLFWLAAAA